MKHNLLILAVLISTSVALLSACDQVRQEDEVEHDTLTIAREQKKELEKKEEVKKTTKKEAEAKLSFSTSEKMFMRTFDTLSLGSNFKKVKETFPAVREIMPEGGSESLANSEGLTETVATIQLLGRQGNIEFNFKNDSLYSYYFTFTENDYEEAERLYNFLHSYYSKQYGDCKKERVEEENRFMSTCVWKAENRFAIMSYNVNAGRISWGYQPNNPF